MAEESAAGVRPRPSRRVHADPERLRRRRDAAGLFQYELAERAGLGPTAVSNAELGRAVSPKTLRLLAEALGCEVEDLIAAPKKRAGTR